MPLLPRLHLFELDDQSFTPAFVRSRVQSCLTLLWTFRVPVLQAASPAALVSRTLHAVLGPGAARLTYVDFCAGAGGPTPTIEREFNALLSEKGYGGKGADGGAEGEATALRRGRASGRRVSGGPMNGGPTNGRTASPPSSGTASGVMTPSSSSSSGTTRSLAETPSYTSAAAVAPPGSAAAAAAAAADFVLTDIAPHRAAWAAASARSAHVHFVPEPVDAAAAPAGLATHATLSPLAGAGAAERLRTRPMFRLFFLAFHHMPDPLARRILKDTLEHSQGFGVFELQGRSLGELVMVLLIAPLMWLLVPFYFGADPLMLLLTYGVPVVPFVLAFDGVVSCLRTRTGGEIERLIEECGASTHGWRFEEGSEFHTWPLGKLRWFVGVKE